MKLIATKYQSLKYKIDSHGVKKYVAILTINHKKYKKTLDSLSLDEAYKDMLSFKKDIITGKSIKLKSTTLDNIFEEYIKLVKPSQSEQTIRTKEGYYKKHVSPKFGNRFVNTISYLELQKFFNFLLVDNSPKTVKHIKDLLQVVYSKAIKLQYAESNPLYFIELPKFDNARYFDMSVEKMRSLYTTIINFEEPLYRSIFVFLLQGRRLNEVLSITWNEIDFSARTYSIPAVINKAKRNMTYEMSNHLFRVLSEHFDSQKNKKGLVFKSPRTGEKIKDVRKAWFRILKKAGVEKMRIHDIRHMIGYYAINILELPIEKVSHMLGHTDITTTQKYVNPRASSAREVSEAMSKSLCTEKNSFQKRLEIGRSINTISARDRHSRAL